MPETPTMAAGGLRERKKRRTREALIDTALDLFLAQGYEATTIDEIVSAVDVSQRTFFRYFGGKEDVVSAVLAEYDALFREGLIRRPAEEAPIQALSGAMRVVLQSAETGDQTEATRFRKVRRLIDTTPALAIAEVRRCKELAVEVVAIIARRMGTDPARDRRPLLITCSFLAVLIAGLETSAVADDAGTAGIARHVQETIDLAGATLPTAWSSRA